MSKKAVRIVQEKVKERRVKGRLLYGYLGNGAGTINVPGRDGYQYARIPVGASGRYAVGVFRGGSDGEENAPIRIEVDPLTVTPANPNGEMAIMGADGAGAANAGVPSGSGSYLKLHEETHRIDGIDQIELNSLQIYQMRTEPSDTPRHVTVRKGLYSVRGTLYYLAADLDVDLTAYYPAAGTKYVYVGIDETGTAVVTDPPATDFPTLLAAWPTDGDFLSSFVGLSVGSSIVPWLSIWDMRFVNDSDTLPGPNARGDILRADASLRWEAYSLAGGVGSILTRDANDPFWSTYFLSGTAGQTYTFPPASATLVGGTAVANQVAYWSDANNITGNASLTYNPGISPHLTHLGVTLFGDKVWFTQVDGNEAIDSAADGYMDYYATNQHRFNNNLVIGAGAAGIDYYLQFNGETNDGTVMFMEDENKFLFLSSIWLQDTEYIYFGTGDGAGNIDVSMRYTGTIFDLHTDLINPSDFHIDCGTDKTVVLDETVWDDIQFSISSGRVAAANYPDWDATFTTNTGEYKFDVNDYIDLGAQEMPHWWYEGSIFYPHVHVALDGANSSGGSYYVKFTIFFAYAEATEVWAETTDTVEIEIPDGTADLTHLLGTGSGITIDKKIGTQTKIRLKRIAATAGDEYPNHIFVTQVGLHAQKDTMGSRGVYTK